MEQASDAKLVVAVGRWHEPALAEIYRRHGGAVHALARRILRSDPPAEEITQEVFLDLWQQPEKFDAQRGTLRSFLLARTHGKSVDFVRSEVARRRREERTSRETATAGYDIDHEVWDMAVADQVKAALGALPDDLRQPDRPGLLWREHLPGGGGDPRRAGGDRQEPDPVRAGSAPHQPGRARREAGRSRVVSRDEPEPTHEEIQELLGVYALDAVDPETAAVVERHLGECVRCSTEVAQHHEVAGLLANSGGASPAELWGGIASQLDGSRLRRRGSGWPSGSKTEPGPRSVAPVADQVDRPPAATGGDVVPIGRGKRRGRMAMRGAVVVAAAAAVGGRRSLGVQVDHLNHQVERPAGPDGAHPGGAGGHRRPVHQGGRRCGRRRRHPAAHRRQGHRGPDPVGDRLRRGRGTVRPSR